MFRLINISNESTRKFVWTTQAGIITHYFLVLIILY